MKSLRRAGSVLAACFALACERPKTPARADSLPSPRPSTLDTTVSGSSPRGRWDDAIGPVLLVPASSPATAFVVTPDSATAVATLAAIPHPASVTLFGRGGTVQTAELSAVANAGVCATGTLSAAPPPRAWSIGFIGGVSAPLAIDSTEAISRSDSSALVVTMNRLASALPNDSAGRFAGLPFLVRSLWRFTIPSGPFVAVGTVTRQINQEATPLQEHTLLVAERAPHDSTFSTAYSERSYGAEETIESRELLAGALVGGARTPALFLIRDYGEATAYGLIERGADGRWRRRWTSTRRHC
jgi:hypothetical protein